ncbi:MAG TPA: DUF4157 domain-containing protein [Egicoccus sp.]|nr:DUF4157 domain-containing protein [Egicoccus sp.]HSK25024.1 DUF4157 domain-containing protein [Egicoccus sp.]
MDGQHDQRVRRRVAARPTADGVGPSDPHGLGALQRFAGNRAVSDAIQASITVGRADDPSEREADAVADRVVAGLRASATPPTPAADQPRAARRFAPGVAGVGAEGGDLPCDDAAELASARGGGRPLEGGARTEMEAAFQADFSTVRVHADERADDLSRSLGADAFTSGNDIFFRAGAYQPASPAGRHLLAHELTHVVQQGGASASADDERVARKFAFAEGSELAKLTPSGLQKRFGMTYKEYRTLAAAEETYTSEEEVRTALERLRGSEPALAPVEESISPSEPPPTVDFSSWTVSREHIICYRGCDWSPGKHKKKRALTRKENLSMSEVRARFTTQPKAWAQDHVSFNRGYLISFGWEKDPAGYGDLRNYTYEVDLGSMYRLELESDSKMPIIYSDTEDLSQATKIAIDPRKKTAEIDFAFDIPLANVVGIRRNGEDAFTAPDWSSIEPED